MGDYPAQSFFSIGVESGAISIARDLKSDNLKLSEYTLRMRTFDSAYPDQTSTATVSVRVTRNEAAPLFPESENYAVEIAENHQLGSSVLQVRADDADDDAVSYRLTGSASALPVFHVNPDSGLVSLKKPLSETGEEVFTVSCDVTLLVYRTCRLISQSFSVLNILTCVFAAKYRSM